MNNQEILCGTFGANLFSVFTTDDNKYILNILEKGSFKFVAEFYHLPDKPQITEAIAQYYRTR